MKLMMRKQITIFLLIVSSIANVFIGCAQSTKNVTPIFKDGEAQIVPAFKKRSNWITHDLWVETTFDTDGDGKLDRMHVSVTRPTQTETENLKLPVVYITSPYFAGVAPSVDGLFWDVKHELGETGKPRIHPKVKRIVKRPYISRSWSSTWVSRGYIVVYSSSPGTGLSDGAPTIGGDNESLAPKAVIDWLCGRAKGYTERNGNEEIEAYWSTGKVGMMGISYNGTLPLAAATTGVEGLEAIIPSSAVTSFYLYYRSNGLVRSPGGYLGEDIDVLYDYVNSGDEDKRPYNNTNIRDKELKNGMDRITGDYNEFWDGRNYLNDIGQIKAALLISHGFNDWNVMPEHSYKLFKAAKEKGISTQIYYHQSGHGGLPTMKMMNRWFTHYLHGIENNVENDHKVWIVREKDDLDAPTPYDDYPNPKASSVTFYLKSGAPGQGKIITDKINNQGIETFVDNYNYSGADLAKAYKSKNRLIYVTPKLKEDIHISGIPKIKIKLSSSKAAANLSVWLVSLPWNNSEDANITDNIITRGWADPQNHNSLTESEPLIPGKFYELSFDLNPDDQIIPKGQRIGLMIFSSDKEFTLWPEPGTELSVDLDATMLILPVVGGSNAFKKAIQVED